MNKNCIRSLTTAVATKIKLGTVAVLAGVLAALVAFAGLQAVEPAQAAPNATPIQAVSQLASDIQVKPYPTGLSGVYSTAVELTNAGGERVIDYICADGFMAAKPVPERIKIAGRSKAAQEQSEGVFTAAGDKRFVTSFKVSANAKVITLKFKAPKGLGASSAHYRVECRSQFAQVKVAADLALERATGLGLTVDNLEDWRVIQYRQIATLEAEVAELKAMQAQVEELKGTGAAVQEEVTTTGEALRRTEGRVGVVEERVAQATGSTSYAAPVTTFRLTPGAVKVLYVDCKPGELAFAGWSQWNGEKAEPFVLWDSHTGQPEANRITFRVQHTMPPSSAWQPEFTANLTVGGFCMSA